MNDSQVFLYYVKQVQIHTIRNISFQSVTGYEKSVFVILCSPIFIARQGLMVCRAYSQFTSSIIPIRHRILGAERFYKW